MIGKEPLYEYSPTFSGGEGGATQFNMDGVEKVGLVKFDFLGLKNLDIVSYAQELVNEEIMRANAGSEADRLRLISSFQHLKAPVPNSLYPLSMWTSWLWTTLLCFVLSVVVIPTVFSSLNPMA